MRVAAIDVGSNTVRLLVATLEDGSVEPVREERTAVGLAREIERTGRIPDEKIARAAEVARRYARDAAKLGAARIEVLVTAPARQGRNGSELVEAISAATRLPVRPLSAEEEGRLAFAGVVSTFPTPPASIAVVDVGGGSTQLVFGTAGGAGLVPDARHRLAAARAAALRPRPAAKRGAGRTPGEYRAGIRRARVAASALRRGHRRNRAVLAPRRRADAWPEASSPRRSRC